MIIMSVRQFERQSGNKKTNFSIYILLKSMTIIAQYPQVQQKGDSLINLSTTVGQEHKQPLCSQ